MFSFIARIYRAIFIGKSLSEALGETKTVRVSGVKFSIKKIDMLDYLDGSKACAQVWSTYKLKKDQMVEPDPAYLKKMREHQKDVLLAGVVYPKLKRNAESEMVGQSIDDLFSIPQLVDKLYAEIMAYTYGYDFKKKVAKNLLHANSS